MIRSAIERAALLRFEATAPEEPTEPTERAEALDGDRWLREEGFPGLAGVGAARLALEVAGKLLRDYALDARAAGRTWDDVAAALELPDQTSSTEPADAHGAPRAEIAFEWLIEDQQPPRPREPRQPWWQPSRVSWRCGTCRNRVIDRGPFESHPDDREYGHAADCARRAAALAQWAHDERDEQEHDEHEHDKYEHVEGERDERGGDGGGGGRR